MEAKIYHLTDAHLPTGGTPACIIAVLENLIAKAVNGELTGLSVSWVEGNNHVCYEIAPGTAEASLMVAGASKLFFEINRRV
jgi:hypothetical protein